MLGRNATLNLSGKNLHRDSSKTSTLKKQVVPYLKYVLLYCLRGAVINCSLASVEPFRVFLHILLTLRHPAQLTTVQEITFRLTCNIGGKCRMITRKQTHIAPVISLDVPNRLDCLIANFLSGFESFILDRLWSAIAPAFLSRPLRWSRYRDMDKLPGLGQQQV